jgi:hypothetical protein
MVAIILVLGASAICWAAILLGGLAGRVAWYAFPLVVPALGIAILVFTAARALWTRELGRSRLVAAAVGLVALYPATWVVNGFPMAYPASADRSRPSLSARLPLDGPVRVLNGGDRKEENRHVTAPHERWAYDFGIDPNPDEFGTPRPSNPDYGCWGAPVVAPVAGVVSGTYDGEDDNAPGTEIRVRPDPAGNYVDLEAAATGTHLLLFHLRRGSIRVAPGEVVAEGDMLATCGSSGNSTIPHVHVHHQREPWRRESTWRFEAGLPLRFRDHTGGANLRGGGSNDPTGVWRYTGTVLRHTAPQTQPASPERPVAIRSRSRLSSTRSSAGRDRESAQYGEDPADRPCDQNRSS